MSLLKSLVIVAIASVLSSPAYADPANSAAKLSLASNESAQTPPATRSAPKPKSTTLPIILVGTVAIVGAALLLGHNDSTPASN